MLVDNWNNLIFSPGIIIHAVEILFSLERVLKSMLLRWSWQPHRQFETQFSFQDRLCFLAHTDLCDEIYLIIFLLTRPPQRPKIFRTPMSSTKKYWKLSSWTVNKLRHPRSRPIHCPADFPSNEDLPLASINRSKHSEAQVQSMLFVPSKWLKTWDKSF